MPCNGDAAQTCGGSGTLNLYVAKDLESLQPCNFGSSSSSSSTTQSSTTSSSISPTAAPTTATTSSSTSPSAAPTTTSAASSPTAAPTSTTTSAGALCTKTVEPECEYKCGEWCSNPIPTFSSSSDCKTAASECARQVAGCFSNAKYPDSMKCFEFSGWCQKVAAYCSSSSCSSGKCSKEDCKSKNPLPSQPAAPSTSVYPCPAKASATPKSTTTATVPVPTSSNICVQPHNPSKGYSRDAPCGGIQLPCLTCNNIKSDYDSGAPFKLYNSKDSSKCSSYRKSPADLNQGCKDACLSQYNSCIGTYAESCKSNKSSDSKSSDKSSKSDNKREAGGYSYSSGSDYSSRKSSDKSDNSNSDNGNSGDDYNTASNKCKNQYNDCLSQNSKVDSGSRCSSFNNGWS